MTLMYLVIDREARRLHLVSAGHDPVMLYDPAKDELRELEGEDIPLGLDRNWTFHEKIHENLPEGALLLIGTDGIWESRNPQDELFGKERLDDATKQYEIAAAAAPQDAMEWLDVERAKEELS
jgi:sigma-B regulation protein RsbU (phosphoserine phosphatase)